MKDYSNALEWITNRPSTVRLILWICALLSSVSVCGHTAGAQVPPASAVAGPGLPIAIADFDGDMRPDVAAVEVARSYSSQTDYWIQLELSSVGRRTIVVTGPAGGLQVAVKDVNGDHVPDLVFTTAWSRQPIAIYLNDGHGTFKEARADEFPGAFGESETHWNCNSQAIVEIASALQRAGTEACTELRGCRSALQQTRAVLAAPLDFGRIRYLTARLGRAPPAVDFL